MKAFKRLLPYYVIGAIVLCVICIVVTQLPPGRHKSIAEMCWNLPVSVTDRPVSSSVIWTLGKIAKVDDRHASVVASYASQRELSPAARQGLCTSLSGLPNPAQAEATHKEG